MLLPPRIFRPLEWSANASHPFSLTGACNTRAIVPEEPHNPTNSVARSQLLGTLACVWYVYGTCGLLQSSQLITSWLSSTKAEGFDSWGYSSFIAAAFPTIPQRSLVTKIDVMSPSSAICLYWLQIRSRLSRFLLECSIWETITIDKASLMTPRLLQPPL